MNKGVLTKKEDASGRAALDYYNGIKAQEIIERDDGYIYATDDVETYFSPYPKWSKQEKQVMDSIKGRTLDVGCNVGRHSRYLQTRQVDVMGIDVSPLLIKLATTMGLGWGYVMSAGDIHAGLGIFSNIILMCNNLGLLGDIQQAKKVLNNFHEITHSNSKIFAQTTDLSAAKERIEKVDQIYSKRNLLRGQNPYTYKIRVRYKNYKTPFFNYTYFNETNLKRTIINTGWRLDDIVTSMDSEMYTAILKKA